jgi:acetyltransferase-like isoleucine patch superfamily enzyme
LSKQSRISEKATFHGRVIIGEGAMVEDYVVLGSNEDGELSIGRNSIIRSGTVIYSGDRIGDNFRSGHNVLIRENTEIGDNVLVGTNSVLDGDCRIGNNVAIQTGAYVTRYTVIKDGAFLGPHCVTTNDKYMEYGGELKGPVIKRNAKIGANATIFPGIIIGENAIVGAGAVVHRNVPREDTVVGNPARSASSVQKEKGRRSSTGI